MSTWKAATYQPGTVAAWADDIADRSREILVRAPTQVIPSQSHPVQTEIEEALDTLFQDGDEAGITLAITDREEVPPGTDIEKAILADPENLSFQTPIIAHLDAAEQQWKHHCEKNKALTGAWCNDDAQFLSELRGTVDALDDVLSPERTSSFLRWRNALPKLKAGVVVRVRVHVRMC